MIEAKEAAAVKTEHDKTEDLALKVLALLQEQDLTFIEATRVIDRAKDKLGNAGYSMMYDTVISSLTIN